ncbi:hypothetical protein J4402_03885 [Candidatus Pacearchaeota archaeon]|nr:hypothetical protein [Candidatus Pacearchaeota archaeon]
MKLWMILVKFLFIGGLFLVSNHNLYLNDDADLDKFFELYTSWLSQLYSQTGEIVGYVTNSEWLPGHESIGAVESLGVG